MHMTGRLPGSRPATDRKGARDAQADETGPLLGSLGAVLGLLGALLTGAPTATAGTPGPAPHAAATGPGTNHAVVRSTRRECDRASRRDRRPTRSYPR
ncbi:hypothetical protein DMH15_31650 [Streptomyces sp. WAC 06725]|nr:hypothetical protein DMH15_31650 [Streptomyces sp. WAC 06725]